MCRDGSLDKDKFRQLLRQVVQGLQPFTLVCKYCDAAPAAHQSMLHGRHEYDTEIFLPQDWLKEVELEEIVFSYDRNKDGKVSLAEFEILVCTPSL